MGNDTKIFNRFGYYKKLDCMAFNENKNKVYMKSGMYRMVMFDLKNRKMENLR